MCLEAITMIFNSFLEYKIWPDSPFNIELAIEQKKEVRDRRPFNQPNECIDSELGTGRWAQSLLELEQWLKSSIKTGCVKGTEPVDPSKGLWLCKRSQNVHTIFRDLPCWSVICDSVFTEGLFLSVLHSLFLVCRWIFPLVLPAEFS